MKKLLYRLFAALFAALLLFAGFAPIRAETETFDDFLTSEWKAMMESDYITMHFSVKDRQSMGLTKPEVTLGEISYASYAEEVQKSQASLEKLHSFDYDSLNDTQKHDYLVYERHLEDVIGRYQYPDFQEQFNPYSGSFADLPTIFTEFVFYEKEDIDDYLILLQDYTRYCNDMMEFTKQQADRGYFLLDAVLDTAEEEIDKFTAKKEDNPFIVIFEENIDAFEGLSDAEKTAYKEKNRDIVLNDIIPENQHIREELEKLRGSRMVNDGLYFYDGERGRNYYAALTRYKTSSDDSMQEIFDYLDKATKESLNALIGVMMSEDEREDADPISGYSSPEEILDHLKNSLQNFPEGPDVNYTPSYLDPSIANPNVLAYYMVCPVDDFQDNVIRINGDLAGSDSSTLYCTLAHEGFPGHLYQFTWYQNTSPNPLRHDVSVMGYQEGWAQYGVRDMVYKSGLDDYSAKMTFLDEYFGYAANAAADVAVNGLGYDVNKLKKWMESAGLDGSGAQDLYDAVISMPGEILPYGYGQMKFLEYRERMISSLGEAYDETEFHRQLLENGPRPFEVVETDLQAYCESRGKSFEKDFTFFASEGIDTSSSALISLLSRYSKVLPYIIGAAVIIVLILLFLIIRGIIRLFRGKKK